MCGVFIKILNLGYIWIAAISFIYLKTFNAPINNWQHKAALIIPMITMPLMIYAGALNHATFFKQVMELRANDVQCLITELQNGGNVNCPQAYPGPLKLAFFNAKNAGASFTRVIPIGKDNFLSNQKNITLDTSNSHPSEIDRFDIIQGGGDVIMLWFTTRNMG